MGRKPVSKNSAVTVVNALLLGLVCLGCDSETTTANEDVASTDSQTESADSDSVDTGTSTFDADTGSGGGDTVDDTSEVDTGGGTDTVGDTSSGGSVDTSADTESASGVDTGSGSGVDTGSASDKPDTGTVDKDTGECVPGEHQCDGKSSEVCGANGYWEVNETCPYSCNPDTGLCDGECVNAKTRCRQGNFETCVQNAWTLSESCAYGCDGSSGCYGECITLTTECADANNEHTCSDGYAWGSPVFCPNGCDVGGTGQCNGDLPLVPFDANAEDLGKPQSWSARYGKTPEIVVASSGAELDVLAQDYDDATSQTAVLIHIAPNGDGYEVTEVDTDLPMLDSVMGLAVDDSGNRYYATGVDESAQVNSEYPPLDTWRSDIVRVVKVDTEGDVVFNIDLDIARHDFNEGAEPIINPMTYATGRLAVGGGEVALLHGINTDPDWSIGGVRHQKSLSTRLDATTGAVTRVSSIWVSHSFDQRLFYDGSGIIELQLGDAYPRQVVMGKNHKAYPLFYIKGAFGENETHTRLGNMAIIDKDPTYGYIALFATESTAATGETISGPRNLAIVRVNATDSSLDPSLPDTLKVNSSGKEQTNVLRWLTSYTSDSGLHAERPKLVGIGNDRFIALWEEWTTSGFNGVYAMVIDDKGDEIVAATLITADDHLDRGDDAFSLNGRAGWMTGTASTGKLHLHLLDASLGYEVVSF